MNKLTTIFIIALGFMVSQSRAFSKSSETPPKGEAPKNTDSSKVTWKVEPLEDSGYEAKSSSSLDLEVTLTTVGGVPAIVSFQPSGHNPDIFLLIYSSGTGGTYEPRAYQEAAVIDVKNKRYLGTGAWKVTPLKADPKAKALHQPEWTWKKDGVLVEDPSTNDHVFISFTPKQDSDD